MTPNNYLARLIDEQKYLKQKIDRLTAFGQTIEFQRLALEDKNDLIEQRKNMVAYEGVLTRRIGQAVDNLKGA